MKEIKKLEDQKNNLIIKLLNGKIIKDNSILNSFKIVPRELFIDTSFREFAYSDRPLPIGFGQTISQPTTVLIMLQLLNVFPENRVLEIGTGSGYNAALLSNLAKSVVTVERLNELSKKALRNLSNSNINNVLVFEGDGKLGYKKLAPYDRIIITAATEKIPKDIENQLALDGLIVAPIGPIHMCEMIKIKKISSKKFETSSHGYFSFVPLI